MSRIVPHRRSLFRSDCTALSLILLTALAAAAPVRAAINHDNKQPAENAAAEAPAPAQDAKNDAASEKPSEDLGEAQLIRVRLPLTGNADSNVISAIQRVVDQLNRQPKSKGRRPTLVLELSAQHGANG